MKKYSLLDPSETLLVGKWGVEDGVVLPDETCNRIEFLKNDLLIKIGTDSSGWKILYKDPNDNRYWELLYLESDMHGGGPPTLRCLDVNLADEGYSEYGDR